MHRELTLCAAGCVLALGLLQACGADDRGAPEIPQYAIAKADSASGDAQVAPAGTMLEQALRVVVTRDDMPVPNVPVVWATGEDSIAPTSATTDSNGIGAAKWTLKYLYAQQVASAGLGANGGTEVLFTAIATPDPRARTTVLVLSEGGNRFDPAELTITVGTPSTGSGPWGAPDTTSFLMTAIRRRSRGRSPDTRSSTASASRTRVCITTTVWPTEKSAAWACPAPLPSCRPARVIGWQGRPIRAPWIVLD